MNKQILTQRIVERRSSSRNEIGDILIETLVATFIASLFIVSLGNQYGQIMRATTQNSVEMQAVAIAMQIQDELRAESYNLVSQYTGNHYPIVDGTTSTDNLFMRPLLVDNTLTYCSGTAGDPKNQVLKNVIQVDSTAYGGSKGTVYVSIGAGPYTGTQMAIIVIPWNDSSGKHVYTTQTLLTQNGLNN